MDPSTLAWTKSFISSYRLTLRALSASVRHHPTSARNLRSLYRPVFRDTAAKLHQQHAATKASETQRELYEWNRRLDRTLAILLSSATTGGQLKRLVRNLSTLTDVYRTRVAADVSARHRRAGEWNGQKVTPVTVKKVVLPNEREEIQMSAWSALGELVLAAENDTQCLLGRQEQRKLAFTRLSVPRRVFTQNQRGIYNVVGKTVPRPSHLKT